MPQYRIVTGGLMNMIKCTARGKENEEAKGCARCGCELSILASICRAKESL